MFIGFSLNRLRVEISFSDWKLFYFHSVLRAAGSSFKAEEWHFLNGGGAPRRPTPLRTLNFTASSVVVVVVAQWFHSH